MTVFPGIKQKSRKPAAPVDAAAAVDALHRRRLDDAQRIYRAALSNPEPDAAKLNDAMALLARSSDDFRADAAAIVEASALQGIIGDDAMASGMAEIAAANERRKAAHAEFSAADSAARMALVRHNAVVEKNTNTRRKITSLRETHPLAFP